MMEKLISIVVPVYNVEKYLKKCVESIFLQTYSNYELILVDDGSTDNSGKICDDFFEKDTRVKVIHQTNQGLSGARNTGIAEAKGEYITFIDSDDYVQDIYLEKLLEMIITYDADMAICLPCKFYDGERPIVESFDVNLTEIFAPQDALESMLYRKKVNSYAWGKLYKKELFEIIRFPEKKLFEDTRTLYKIYHISKRIAFNPARLYFYYQRQGSIVNSQFNKKKLEQVTANEEILEFVKHNYPDIQKAAISKYFVAAADIYRQIPKDVEYKAEKDYVQGILLQYRKIVWKDKKNKVISRIMALVAIVDIRLLRIMCKIYELLKNKKILVVKNPV